MDNLFAAEKAEAIECKGLFFRGYNSLFTDGKGRVERKEGIRILKKMSCPGCGNCGWLLDDLREEVACETLVIPEIEHGAIYSLRIINQSRDWETGQVDSWEMEVFKTEEEK